MDLSKRNTALDLARITALLTVIGVHFFLNNGYYAVELTGAPILAITVVRCMCMTCVPLFLFLTGYLMNGKKLSAGYYKGLDKTLGVYVLASVVCYLMKRFYLHIPELSLFSITDYTMCDYAWYVEMYIGLFLLIPFLNLAYHGLTSKKQKQVLVLTAFAVFLLPAVTNVYNFKTEGFWAHPGAVDVYQKLLPAFWTGAYPLAYYFAGAYLKEYPVKLKKSVNILLIAVSLLVYWAYSVWHSDGGVYFKSGTWQNWNSPLLFVYSLFVFIFFINLDCSRYKNGVRSFLAGVSDVTFGGYLMSCIFDKIIYRSLANTFDNFYAKFSLYIPCVLLIFVLSLLSSYVLSFVFGLLKEGAAAVLSPLISKLSERKKSI